MICSIWQTTSEQNCTVVSPVFCYDIAKYLGLLSIGSKHTCTLG